MSDPRRRASRADDASDAANSGREGSGRADSGAAAAGSGLSGRAAARRAASARDAGGSASSGTTDAAATSLRQLVRHRRRPGNSRIAITSLKLVAATLAVVLVSGISVTSVYAWKLTQTLDDNSVDISNGDNNTVAEPPAIGAFDGGFNVLAVGADNIAGQDAAFGDRDASLNDVNILLHVSADHTSATVVSFPRDLVIPGPACTDPDTGRDYSAVSAQPLNTAYARGGLGCVVATVSTLTGLDIPYAGLFTFGGTVAMSDAVGGVPICLEEAIEDPFSGLDLPEGVSIVQGQQALAYLRSRKGVGDGGDLSRISSQQAYMSSMMRVMKSDETLTDVSKVFGLANAAAENVILSNTLSPLPTMVSLALTLKDLDLNNMTFVTFPTVPYPVDVNKLIPSETLAEELVAKLQNDEPIQLDANALRDGSIVNADGTTTDPVPTDAATGTPTDSITGEPTATATAGADPNVVAGLQGQSAAQQTCSAAFGS
jgi:LCP family protein required for cell wall assembly